MTIAPPDLELLQTHSGMCRTRTIIAMYRLLVNIAASDALAVSLGQQGLGELLRTDLNAVLKECEG
jgi:hypothetical protein